MTDRATRRSVLRGLGAGSALAGLQLTAGLGAATSGTTVDEIRWEFVPPARDRGLETRATTSPTVVDGTVYVGTVWVDQGAEDGDAAERGGLYAVDAETGDADWEFETGGAVLGAPQVVDGTAYVVSWVGPGSDLSKPPYFALQAVDADSGEGQWRTHAGHWGGSTGTMFRTAGHGAWGSSPVVYDGTVYVASLAEPGNGSATADGAYVGAYDAASGSLVWQRSLANEFERGRTVTNTSVTLSNPTALNGLVHVAESGPAGSVLWAFDATSGDAKWRYDMVESAMDGGAGVGQHTLAKGVVYVDGGAAQSDRYRTGYAVDAETGDLVGEIGGIPDKTLGPYNLTVSNHFAIEDAIHGHNFRDTETGKTLFSSDSTRWVTVAGGLVFVCIAALEESYVAAIDMNGEDASETRWSVSFDPSTTEFFGAPTVVDGTLYWAGWSESGTALWALPAGTMARAKDSRVLLGTLGHHDSWTGEDFAWDEALDMGDRNNLPDPTPTVTNASGGTSGTNESESGGGSGSNSGGTSNSGGGSRTTSGSGPGMDVATTIAALAGGGYLLSSRRDEEGQ